VQQAGKDDNTD